jgi:glycosyltransferase involved in cell wall biosynthesis
VTTFTYFEPLIAGHCAFWARMVLAAAGRDPRITRLRLVTGAAMAERLSDVIGETSLELEVLAQSRIRPMEEGRLLDRGRAQWAEARAILEPVGGHLFLPFFDHALYGAILDRKRVNGKVSGIIFRPPNDFNYPSTVNRRLDAVRRWTTYVAATRPALGRLFTLDERAPESRISRAMHILTYLPDPVPDIALLQGLIPEPRLDGRRSLLLFGALSERKGVFQALEAIHHLSAEDRRGLALRFVGRVDPADSAVFLSRLEEIRVTYPEAVIELENRFVSDSELAREVVDCAVVLAPYQNHVGSSGVIFWASAAGKPLLSQNTGLMGYQIDRHKLGLAVDTTDPKALAEAFSSVRKMPVNQGFIDSHSSEAFTRTILDGTLT